MAKSSDLDMEANSSNSSSSSGSNTTSTSKSEEEEESDLELEKLSEDPGMLSISAADPDLESGAFLIPGSGIRCLFDPWIWDPGWKNLDPGYGINIPDPQHCCQ